MQLYSELEKASPQYAQRRGERVCLYRVQLAFLGDDNALKALKDQSQSKIAADASAGKIGLLVFEWWNDADAAKQTQELAEFEELVKANPRDDLMCGAPLDVARYGQPPTKSATRRGTSLITNWPVQRSLPINRSRTRLGVLLSCAVIRWMGRRFPRRIGRGRLSSSISGRRGAGHAHRRCRI